MTPSLADPSLLDEVNDILGARDFGVWGFTSVVYEKGDRLSFILGVLSLAPLALILVSITVAVVIRVLSPQATKGKLVPSVSECLLSGMFINFVISYVLKKYIRQPRPDHPWEQAKRSDHGMPSNHSQLVFHYFAAVLFARIKLAKPFSARTWVQVGGLFCLAVLVAWSRVYNHYHTVGQVTVGMLLGIGIAACAEYVHITRSIFVGFAAFVVAPVMNIVATVLTP